MVANKKVLLKSWAKGYPTAENFEIVTEEIDLEAAPGSGQVLVQVLYMSLDPYLRGRMMEGGPGYLPAFQLGKPLDNGGVAKVLKSNNPKHPEGSVVSGTLPWAEYAVLGEDVQLTPVDNKGGFPLSYYTGILGMPGMTAYAGLAEIGQPKEGETVLVSAASGAVGQVVGQIAKLKGCRVVGTAGSDHKVDLLKSKFHFDEGINYKTTEDLTAAIKKACPNGVDVYWENVGGKTLDAALANCNTHARIPLCGMISQYNKEDQDGIKNLMLAVSKRLKLQGFIVFDLAEKVGKSFLEDMTQWLKEGKINYVEDVTRGLENAPKGFIGMLKGDNIGKAVVEVAPAPSA